MLSYFRIIIQKYYIYFSVRLKAFLIFQSVYFLKIFHRNNKPILLLNSSSHHPPRPIPNYLLPISHNNLKHRMIPRRRSEIHDVRNPQIPFLIFEE